MLKNSSVRKYSKWKNNNWKNNKWKWMIALVAALILTRIIYVNAAYPKTEVTYYKVGDSVPYQDFQIVCRGVELFKGSDFSDYLKEQKLEYQQEQIDEVTGKKDAYIYLAELEVTNASGESQEFNARKAVLCIGNSLNTSYNSYITGTLNGGEARKMIEPGQTVHITTAYNLSKSTQISTSRYERLIHGKCSVCFYTFYQMNQIEVSGPIND